MRMSRGMGAVSKAKLRSIKKRDGNEPVALYGGGGGVNAAGKQFVAQPKTIAKKTKSFRV